MSLLKEKADDGDFYRYMMNTEVKVEVKNTIKGYLFNLIIYTHENRRSDYFQHIVKAFIEKYPCRVIFIKSSKELKQDFLEASTVFDKTLDGTCDQFAINVSQSLLHKVPFVILPKLIPDLPIYLVWGQNPTSDNEILPHLQKLATRFVFDSECAKDLRDFSSKMLEKIAELKIDFMDVSWADISGWRDAISQTFHSPEKLEYLQQCIRLLIKYNNVESEIIQHSAIQAIYLQGWLAAQLGWKFEAITYNDEIILTYKLPQSTLEVVLQPQDRPTLDRGSVFEVEFQGMNEVKTTMTLAEKQSKVMVYLSTPEKCELPFSHPVPDLSKGLTAMKEVFYYRVSKHYTNMLKVLKQIPWKEF